jgi:hypothetical protein
MSLLTFENDSVGLCPDGEYWISPHQRKRVNKKGEVYVQHVKGYCCSYRGSYQKIAEKEIHERAWQKCKDTYREVINAPESENPIPQTCHYFSGKPAHQWQTKYFDLPDVPNFHFVKLDK